MRDLDANNGRLFAHVLSNEPRLALKPNPTLSETIHLEAAAVVNMLTSSNVSEQDLVFDQLNALLLGRAH